MNTFSVTAKIQVNSFHAACLFRNDCYWEDKREGNVDGSGRLLEHCITMNSLREKIHDWDEQLY